MSKTILIPAEKADEFKKYGFNVSLAMDSVFCHAVLPEGWTSKDISRYSDHINRYFYDDKGKLKIFVNGKTASYDSYCNATFYSDEEAEETQKRLDDIDKEKNEKKNRLAKCKEEAMATRKEEWKPENPYGVFWVADMSDLLRAGYPVEPTRRSTQGFWETEELAKKAKEYLESVKGWRDSVFVQKVEPEKVRIVKDGGYKLANGFVDSNWYGKSTW